MNAKFFSGSKIAGSLLVALTALNVSAEPMKPQEFKSLQALYGTDMVGTNLLQAEKTGAFEANVANPIWSDSYWPYYLGGPAHRYMDPAAPNSRNTSENYAYFMAVPPQLANPQTLSPAEKYDLLMGDSSLSLTRFFWQTAERIQGQAGEVPAWMGLDHGWSAAAIATPNPLRSVTLKSVNGNNITFYPSDIKALATILFAGSTAQTHFFGSRCQSRLCPGADPNPAGFHMLLLNQIGKLKKSFVMDSVPDEEVWNFPIQSYRMRYWNLETDKIVGSIHEAKVPFYSAAADAPTWKVGFQTEIVYVTEVKASHQVTSTPATRTLNYKYFLELDAEGNVLGGEWVSQIHPDFFWFYPDTSLPMTASDALLSPEQLINGNQIPATWTEAAAKESAKGSALGVVVQHLLDLAKNP